MQRSFLFPYMMCDGTPGDGEAECIFLEEGIAPGPEYIKALAVAVRKGTLTISDIQRKCGLGYLHAGKIFEWMESMGYIAPFSGMGKPREVLLTKEEFELKFGSLDAYGAERACAEAEECLAGPLPLHEVAEEEGADPEYLKALELLSRMG